MCLTRTRLCTLRWRRKRQTRMSSTWTCPMSCRVSIEEGLYHLIFIALGCCISSGLLPKFPKTPTAADSKIVSRPINQGQRPINQGQRPQNLEPLVVMDLCYFVGKDIYNSHLTPETFDWFDYSLESYKQYLNLLTFETNKIMSELLSSFC